MTDQVLLIYEDWCTKTSTYITVCMITSPFPAYKLFFCLMLLHSLHAVPSQKAIMLINILQTY